MSWSLLLPFVLFVAGVGMVIWATERLLEGLVELAYLVRVSTFAIAAVLSGSRRRTWRWTCGGEAWGFGGGLGDGVWRSDLPDLRRPGAGDNVLYPLRANLPRGFLVLLEACPVLSGLCLIGDETNPLAGVALLLAFVAATAYLILASRHHTFLESGEVREAREERRSYRGAVGLTVVGILVIALGGELVAEGAGGIVLVLGCLVYSSAW